MVIIGVAGIAFTDTKNAGTRGPVPQELVPATVIGPERAIEEKSTVMALVLEPENDRCTCGYRP